jgi:enamine deaminase RidA (YjgF/YER057c/UK114 family)
MGNEIQRLQTNARMSQVVVANGMVYLSGQVPHTPNASIEVQTTEVLDRIDKLLETPGIDKTRLLTANIWLSSPEHFAEFNGVWDA